MSAFRFFICITCLLCGPVAAQQGYTGDAKLGEVVFEACLPCHSKTPGEHMAGPTLYGLFGRRMGSAEGYEYSEELAAETHIWDSGLLSAWLVDPTILIPDTMMHIDGLETRQDIENVIAYIATLQN